MNSQGTRPSSDDPVDLTPGINPAPLPGKTPALSKSLAEAARLIERSHRILIAAHMGPDGDALGSTLGLTSFLRARGKRAVAYNRDGAPYNLQFLHGSDDIICTPTAVPPDLDVLIVLDCSSFGRVDGRLSVDRRNTRVICIDHHKTIDRQFADVLVHDVEASSTGELVYRLIVEMGGRLTQEVAECLFVAVHTDTGSFRYSNASPAALAAAGELVRAGVDVWKVCSATYEDHPVGRVRLLAMVLQTLCVSSCGRFAFLVVTREMFEQTGTGPEVLDGFINFARGIQGVEVAAQLREVAVGSFRVSLRSRGSVDVASLAARFDGGGHHNAAGCGIKGTRAEVVSTLTHEFQAVLDE